MSGRQTGRWRSDRTQVTTFTNVEMRHTKQNVVLGKTITRRLRSPTQGFWFPEFLETCSYEYDRGQLSRVSYLAEDFCPSVPECDTCEFECAPSEQTRYAEYYSHDIFGRRIETIHCDTPHLNPPPDEFFSCKWQTTMYDYDGLSQSVLAIRQSPVLGDQVTTADRYLSTFTYGALGVIARTEEFGNADPTDNADHYYLADATGGKAALYLDHDGDAMTPRLLDSQVFDAFGNRQAGSIDAGAEYGWRGTEDSETESAPNLVLMQARHYDPELGRFLQADSLPMASLTTQGMNRYIYCENDPVNASDPDGRLFTWLGTLAAVAMVGVVATAFLLGSFVMGLSALFGAVMGMMFEMFRQAYASGCQLTASQLDWDAILLSGLAGAALGAVGLTPAGGFARGTVTTILTNLALRGAAAGAVGMLIGLTQFLALAPGKPGREHGDLPVDDDPRSLRLA